MVSATSTIDGGGGGTATALPVMMGPLSATSVSSAAVAEDPSKKIRKPYTITKSRESWTDQEHDKFLEALQLFDRDWKKIEAFVGSKTVIQIRSHAQKYFMKVQKNGTSEHVPPPRPKRKAAHPYPQKASKNAYQASSCLLEPGYVPRTDSSSVLRNSSTSGAMSSWAHSSVHPRSAHMTKENIGPARTMVSNNSCSSTESPPSTWLACETIDQGNHVPSLRDFAQVYSFIGSVFDPNTSGHLEKLKEMDPIDVETETTLSLKVYTSRWSEINCLVIFLHPALSLKKKKTHGLTNRRQMGKLFFLMFFLVLLGCLNHDLMPCWHPFFPKGYTNERWANNCFVPYLPWFQRNPL